MRAPARARQRALELATHRARCTTWTEHALAWREAWRCISAPLPRASAHADLTVVLPQWGRLRNAELAVWLALASPRVARVVVVNDNPHEKISRWVCMEDPRLVLIDHAAAMGPVCRYFEARGQPGDRFVSVDDDLFLLPSQFEALGDALAREPHRPHGIYGQRWRETERGFVDNIVRTDGAVDVLNRAYAFTRMHLEAYFVLLDELGVSGAEALMELDDDIPISFVGDSRPRCHELGAFLDCPSEHSSKGARWRRHRAAMLRTTLFERTRVLRPVSHGGDDARARRAVWPRSLPWALALAPTGLGWIVPRMEAAGRRLRR